MKKSVLIFIALLTTNTIVMAQHSFKVEKEAIINVSADKLWELIGPGFEDVYKWSSNVDHAKAVGKPFKEGVAFSERTCNVNVKGFSKISEELTIYDEAQRNLAYKVKEGMPFFVTEARNDWKVVELNKNTSKLIMNAYFNSKGFMGWMMKGMMKNKMNETLDTVLNDAKVYAETGKVSIEKQKRMEKLAKKGIQF